MMAHKLPVFLVKIPIDVEKLKFSVFLLKNSEKEAVEQWR